MTSPSRRLGIKKYIPRQERVLYRPIIQPIGNYTDLDRTCRKYEFDTSVERSGYDPRRLGMQALGATTTHDELEGEK